MNRRSTGRVGRRIFESAFAAFFLGALYGAVGWRAWAIDALDGVIVVGLLTLYRLKGRL